MHGQIVINEVLLGNQYLELHNTSDTTVNVSQYYIVVNNQPIRIGTHIPSCSGVNFDVEAGEFFGWDIYVKTDTFHGEVVLFKNSLTNDPEAAIDYVQWGSSGHPYETLADSANLWTSGDYVEVILEGGSLERIEPGIQSSNWAIVAVESFCETNGTGCETLPFNEFPVENPFLVCLGGGGRSYFGYNFGGNTFEEVVTMALDGDNRILGFSDLDNGSTIDLQWLTPSDTFGIHSRLLGHHGPIGNLAVGNNLSDLYGCFYFSEPHDADVYFLDKGTLSAHYIDSVYTGTIELCAIDTIPDVIRLENSATTAQNAFVAYNDIDNRVFAIAIDSMTLELDNTPYTDIVVFSFTFQDSIEGKVGDLIHQVSGYPCDINAFNQIFINTDLCISSSEIPEDHLLDFYLSPNPAYEHLALNQLPAATKDIQIFNTFGQLVIGQQVDYVENPFIVDVSLLPSGLYVVFAKGEGFYIQKSFIRV